VYVLQGPAVQTKPCITWCLLFCLLAGFFTPRAEITNGRAAMLGFAVLVALEYKAGVPFF
jgi:hypothetical protein